MNDTLDNLVGEWMTLPDVAEALGLEIGKVRRLVSDRHLVGVRRGERHTFQVPAAFLVPADGTGQGAGSGAAGAGPAITRTGPAEVLASLRGTILVLADAGYSDDDILRWLFQADSSLGIAPIQALRSGRKTEVRRVAQALAF